MNGKSHGRPVLAVALLLGSMTTLGTPAARADDKQPFSVAAVWLTAEAGSVTTVGGLGSVLNVRSLPSLVP